MRNCKHSIPMELYCKKCEDEHAVFAEKRWQKALSEWETLGYHSKIKALAFRLQDLERKKKRRLDGETAFHLAQNQIDRSEGDQPSFNHVIEESLTLR